MIVWFYLLASGSFSHVIPCAVLVLHSFLLYQRQLQSGGKTNNFLITSGGNKTKLDITASHLIDNF